MRRTNALLGSLALHIDQYALNFYLSVRIGQNKLMS